MKKTILYMAVATLMLSGCSIDVNHDPNHPTNVDPALELPGAESSLATVAGDGMETPSGIFVQYFFCVVIAVLIFVNSIYISL
jgi:hypothetical protein